MGLKKKISASLPDGVKRTLRPAYRRLFPAPPTPTSTIEIQSIAGFDIAYRSHTTDEDVIQHSFGHDIFLPGVPEYTPADDHVIIDVGAHIGTFSLLAGSKTPRGRVYGIEACRETFNLLRINAALNHADNIEPVHLALSDRAGTCKLYYSARNWGHTIVAAATGISEEVPADTLEHFIQSRDIAHVHFMKLNCEGAEFPILLGAPAATLRKIGAILILYHCDLYQGKNEQDLAAHLRSAGFNISFRNQSRNRGWIVATADKA